MKHRVDGLCELGAIRFVDTAGVHPKVFQAVTSSLFFAKPDLIVASFALPGTIYQVSKGDLLCSLCMRKYSKSSLAVEVLNQAKPAIVVAFQKSHDSTRFEREGILGEY